MAIGFVLISAAPAREHEVYNKLSKVPQIVELHPLFGEYDLIAKIEADDFEYLARTLANRLVVPISYIFRGIDEDPKVTLLYFLKV